MPDIAMCPGDDCPVKDGCYRYRAKPSDRQAWMAVPTHVGDAGCHAFMRWYGQPHDTSKCDHPDCRAKETT